MQLPAEMPCGIAVRATLSAWNATGEMFRDAGGRFGALTWRLATRQLGTWVVVHLDPPAMPRLARIDQHGTVLTRFGPRCEPTYAREGAPAATGRADTFGDDDLQALVSAEANGVIYVWSPHMPLSVDGYRHLERATVDLRIAMTALLDPTADAAYARAVAGAAEFPESALRSFRSVELTFRNATVHAPSLLVYTHGRMIGLAVPGYRDAAGYRHAIENQLGGADDRSNASAGRERQVGRR